MNAKMSGHLYVIIGPSGSGKSTLEDIFVQAGYEKIVTATTRPPRVGEVDGADYHFLSNQDFDDAVSERQISCVRSFVVFEQIEAGLTRANSYRYGIPTDSIRDNENQVIVLDLDGYHDLITTFEFEEDFVRPVFLFAPKDELIRRVDNRNRIAGEKYSHKHRIEAEHLMFSEYFKNPQPYIHSLGNHFSSRVYQERTQK